MTRPLLAATALAAAALPAGAQSVWTVDDDGGVGVDFTSLQQAVDAAADGDVLVVRAGTYAKTSILAKGLVVAADVGAQVDVSGALSVRGLAASQSVVLRGLDVVSPVEQGLYLVDCDGPIWVEDCALLGAVGDNTFAGFSTGAALHSFPGARIFDCAEVVLARCTLQGGGGTSLIEEKFEYDAGDGGDGLLVDGALVSLFDCTLSGGGGGGVFDTTTDDGGNGGSGVHILAGSVFASGCATSGGWGGSGDANFISCGNGGHGGHGFWLTGGSAELRWQDCTFAPGTGGQPGPLCSPGADGQSIRVDGGTVAALPGVARPFAATSPHRAGESTTLSAGGPAGEVVLAGIAASQDRFPADAFAGDLVLDPAFVLIVLGSVPPSGTLDALVPIPPAASAATLARTLYVQTAHVAPSRIRLGHASALLLLDATL